MLNKLAFLMFIFFTPFLSFGFTTDTIQNKVDYKLVFIEICSIIDSNYYDKEFVETKFKLIKKEFGDKLDTISSSQSFSAHINNMLSLFKASHTKYYTKDDYAYYHYASIFYFLPSVQEIFNNKPVEYPSIGIITENFGQKTFIVSVLPGTIAEKSGLLVGDEIISADGKNYEHILLLDTIDKPLKLQIRRKEDLPILSFEITPIKTNPKKEMLDAQNNSIRIIETEGFKIGYIHIWSYAGSEYQQAFIDAIAFGKLEQADALVYDIRYGFGGASSNYLNVFNKNVPKLIMTDRNGNNMGYDTQWRKPVVMLVNHSVRSGKEILAFGFKKYKIGTIIGEKTSGATLGGMLFTLSNKDILYLATAKTSIDGINLEGTGVQPDIFVLSDIKYCAGKDNQQKKALEYLLSILKENNHQ